MPHQWLWATVFSGWPPVAGQLLLVDSPGMLGCRGHAEQCCTWKHPFIHLFIHSLLMWSFVPCAGLSSQWLASLTARLRCERIQVRITPLKVVFISDGCCDIQSWARAVHTFTAVLRSTQPSTLRGTVKWVSAYVLNNNNNGDGGCGW